MQELISPARGACFSCLVIIYSLILASCSMQARIPTVSDASVELLVRDEAAQIVMVSEDKNRISDYQIFVSDFPRKDILGMSIGNGRIYISYELAKLASKGPFHLWLLRQTLAHEIAHETAGHAKRTGATAFNRAAPEGGVSNVDVGLPGNVTFHNYSMDKELEADSIGLQYWKKLGWDCRIWVRILQGFQRQNYMGDLFHPTGKRLQQARTACLAEPKNGKI